MSLVATGRQDGEEEREEKGNSSVEPRELGTSGVVYREEVGGKSWNTKMERHWFGTRSCGLDIQVGLSSRMAGKRGDLSRASRATFSRPVPLRWHISSSLAVVCDSGSMIALIHGLCLQTL